MAMRRFSQSEFFTELKKLGLKPTNQETRRTAIWLDGNSTPVTIPIGQVEYPDYILDEIICLLEKIKSEATPIRQETYTVKPVAATLVKKE
jgi:hypothetical protein